MYIENIMFNLINKILNILEYLWGLIDIYFKFFVLFLIIKNIIV